MKRKAEILLCVLAGLGTTSPAVLAQESSTAGVLKAEIAPQAVAEALTALARQSGLQIIYGTDIVQGLRSNGAPAGLSASETLERVLDGTGLTYEFLNDHTVTIVRRPASSAALTRTSLPTQAEADDAGRIEEIVVTATKRAESLSKVPASIAVVAADEIDRRGLVSAEDYLRGIPGVSQVANQTGAAIVIRGIETSPQAQNFSAGTTVATYFGETPTTNSAGLGGGSNVDLKLVDIERVEVLRGPQGTAFGNSSLGGAVRTIPVAPKLNAAEGKVGVGYSVTSGTGGDNTMVQATG
ncbi:TonB-dependent receptor plug domain-containing protein, partial [Steroidobacter sp.]|uniref:TonB-dependent receptor plug domain-containing protein n=1 Tax=Steroidobacter sp. TaxID=1978227 RepID=UPI001A4C039C